MVVDVPRPDFTFIVTRVGAGPGYTLSDADLWGVYNCIQHCIDSGYLDDNRLWGDAMLERIRRLRGVGGE